MGSYSTLYPNLVLLGAKSHSGVTDLMRTTILVWHRARARYCSPGMFSPPIPLWGNPNLPHMKSVPDPQVWATRGIVSLKHVSDGRLRSFPDLKAAYALPQWIIFR